MPNHILIGAMNPLYFVLLAISVYVEVFLGTGRGGLTPYLFAFNNNNAVPDGREQSKQMVQNVLSTEILNRPEFGGPEKKGHLGIRSMINLSATHTRNNGCTKDEKYLCGQWKSKGRVSDVYDDIEIPFPDAKVAGKLCIGGPWKYVVKENSGITNGWLLKHLVPNTCTGVSYSITVVLSKALLWFALRNVRNETYLPQDMTNHIRTAYAALQNDFSEGENPIQKILWVMAGHEQVTYLDGIGGGNDSGRKEGDIALRVTSQRDQLLAVHSKMLGIRRDIHQLNTALEAYQVHQRREFEIM